MAIVKLCNGIITGLQADSKPTTYPNGTKLITTDDGREWKYINGEWLEREVVEFFDAGKKFGGFIGGSGASVGGGYGFWEGGIVNHIINGSYANPVDSTGSYSTWGTTTTINSIGGNRTSGFMTERDLNPWTKWRVRLRTAITNARMFLGLRSTASVPASSADPLAAISGVGFWFDTGVHATNIAILQNNGGANGDKTTIANVGTMVINAINTYEIRADNTNSKFQYRFNGFPNGSWTDISTVIPAATTDLQWLSYEENLDTVSHNIDIYDIKVKQDG
jgi:hypothetical protein